MFESEKEEGCDQRNEDNKYKVVGQHLGEKEKKPKPHENMGFLVA